MNTLYPIFLKLSAFEMLIVGGGKVGFEKLSFILKSSPDARITVIAPEISEPCMQLIQQNGLVYKQAAYHEQDLDGKKMVIAATNQPEVNRQICTDARARGILVNVADTPELCDFYLGSIVTRGDLKLAISTNGKSPTLAKRLREFFEALLPENIDELAQNLHKLREQLGHDLQTKIDTLNKITSSFKAKDR